ncbi:unnamed protein product [Blepharisma stoltei]|uniref:O-methyltransferase C-terminal domain-containing protein n=1 Tax=Blepharisma stoltei TaxID=1481888 RepID=A0AAU9J0R6_9CILI|nr:unnamed protein product [Blepharisma stoltei]
MDEATVRSKIFQILIGPQLAAMIYSSLDFNLPHLLSTPKTIATLSQITSTIPEKLERLLQGLEAFGYFSHNQQTDEWSNSPLSAEFLDESFFEVSKYRIMPYRCELLCNFYESLKQEESAQEIRFGSDYFNYLRKKPELLNGFIKANSSITFEEENLIEINLGNAERVLDIGGGNGAFLIALAKLNRQITGSVLELPEVMSLIHENITKNLMEDRVTAIEGDFFGEIPRGYDCLILKNVLPHWNDRDCKRILDSCRNSMERGNQLKLLETTSGINPHELYSTLQDLNYMAIGRGKVRNQREIEKMLNESGFRLESATPIVKMQQDATNSPLDPTASYLCFNAIAI